MPYPIEQKLVIGVASSALFDLTVSDDIYQAQGVEAYRQHQQQNLDEPFPKGVAFPFIRRFLSINQAFPEQLPVEVVLLSRNSPETGLRVFRSISHYQLDITRAAFMSGRALRVHPGVQCLAVPQRQRGGCAESHRRQLPGRAGAADTHLR